jgi:hypothetical protein
MTSQNKVPDTGTFYETTDLNGAGFLLTNRVQYRGDERAEDGRTIFRFKHDDRIADLISDFVNGAEVVAKDFASALRFLTGQIKQNRRNGGTR